MSALDKLMFLPSLLFTVVMDKATDQNWYDRIDNCVILGALPMRSTISKLAREQHVRGVLSMNENFELNALWYPSPKEMSDDGVKFKQLPVTDYVGQPTWVQAQEGLVFIDNICSNNGTVYVHCKAGRYRSALMTATYLMHRYNMTSNEATANLRQHRPQVWLQNREIQALNRFYANMHVQQPPLD